MLSVHTRITYVPLPGSADSTQRERLADLIQRGYPNQRATLSTVPFDVAAQSTQEFISEGKPLGQLFGDIVVIETEILPDQDLDSYRAAHGDEVATQPFELGCAIAGRTRTVAVLFLAFRTTQPTVTPFPVLQPDDPYTTAKLAEAYHRIRLGLGPLLPRQPYVEIDEDSVSTTDFEAGPEGPNQQIPELLSFEFPSSSAQLALVQTCSHCGFADARHAPEAAIVARVCRHIASLTNEGRHLRAGIIMVVPSWFNDRFADITKVARLLPERESEILKSATRFPLPKRMPVDMRHVDDIVRLCEGLDGVGAVLVVDWHGSAFAVVAIRGRTRADTEEFLAVTSALGGLGFFVPGDQTVHIGASPPFFAINFTRDRWYADMNVKFRLSAMRVHETMSPDSSIDVFARLVDLVGRLSRLHVGSFLIWGGTASLLALRTGAASMRSDLNTICDGRQIEEFSDDSLLQLFSLDGAHLVDCDGTIRGIGLHLRPGGASAEAALTGTKRSTAQLITREREDIMAITISHDGPVRLWRGGQVIIDAEL